MIEAPNWSIDGAELIVNADGSLWQISIDGSEQLTLIESAGLPPINNDHLLHPAGNFAYVSGRDGHFLHRVDLISPKPARRISNEHSGLHHYYLHGISPDGSALAYVAREQRASGVIATTRFTILTAGGSDFRLTDLYWRMTGLTIQPMEPGSISIPNERRRASHSAFEFQLLREEQSSS